MRSAIISESNMHFLMRFTPRKGEQRLQGIELQQKKKKLIKINKKVFTISKLKAILIIGLRKKFC